MCINIFDFYFITVSWAIEKKSLKGYVSCCRNVTISIWLKFLLIDFMKPHFFGFFFVSFCLNYFKTFLFRRFFIFPFQKTSKAILFLSHIAIFWFFFSRFQLDFICYCYMQDFYTLSLANIVSLKLTTADDGIIAGPIQYILNLHTFILGSA